MCTESIWMTEILDDTERSELGEERKKKKEMTMDDILKCPTWDCDGGPEVWPTGVYVTGGELWCVGCPKCKGWISQFLIPDTVGESDGDAADIDPYMKGTEIWVSMRKEMGR